MVLGADFSEGGNYFGTVQIVWKKRSNQETDADDY
jgi:hypothetical protein